MFIPRTVRNTCAIIMSVFLTNLPAQGLTAEVATAKGQMISTSAVVEELSRSEAEARIQGFLDHDEVRKALEKQGLSKEEVKNRLASLSDSEIKQMSNQMEQARYGGDILVTVLLVVLIIFLIKRI